MIYNLYLSDKWAGDPIYQASFLSLEGAMNHHEGVTWTPYNGGTDPIWCGEYRGIKDWYMIRQEKLHP